MMEILIWFSLLHFSTFFAIIQLFFCFLLSMKKSNFPFDLEITQNNKQTRFFSLVFRCHLYGVKKFVCVLNHFTEIFFSDFQASIVVSS